MSGASKRLHEDGGHSTPVKRSHEESSMFSSLSGKTIQPLANDFHLPYEPGLDGRPVKVQRIETRDSDKRPLHRMSSSPNHVMDHPTTSENRPELRASKEVRDGRTVVRELKSDTRDSCIDIKVDLQVSKAESDTRDIRGDEKDLRSDRGSYNDFKGVKFERDSYAASISLTTWKESKDHLWPRRYAEPANENVESWRIARHLQNTIEVGKDQPARTEDRTPLGSYEGIAEAKIDLKGEDKFREKDKKKKDDRQKDFGEWDKDKSDRRGSTHLGEINNEGKELKEDRELERWERERMDIQKEQNDPEKDHVKRESSNSNERENSHYVKEVHEGSIKISDQAVSSSDPRRPKDDGWKGSDRDLRDKKREKDADVGDRYGQAGKCYDKDLDDGTEGDAGLERDRDAFGYGIQQRRRMLRSRGASQPINREPRFRSRARDHDGYGFSTCVLYAFLILHINFVICIFLVKFCFASL